MRMVVSPVWVARLTVFRALLIPLEEELPRVEVVVMVVVVVLWAETEAGAGVVVVLVALSLAVVAPVGAVVVMEVRH